MGNEAGMGINFEKCYEWIRHRDPSRPVQYEPASATNFSDIYCPMYPSPDDMVYHVTKDSAYNKKPFILVEYAHAMGNTDGNFNDYWDTIRKYYPKMQGGYIWDFVDQGFQKITDRGDTIWSYGGDYGVDLPSDENFNDNGLVAPDRSLHPHMLEVKKIYQDIFTTPADVANGKVNVYNENFFKDLSNVYLEWELVGDGKVIDKGKNTSLRISPQQTSMVDLHYKAPTSGYNEVFLNLYYKTKINDGLVAADWEIAKDQLVVYSHPQEPVVVAPVSDLETNVSDSFITVSAADVQFVFDRKDGLLHHYIVDGKDFIKDGFSLKPNFWRPPTDNDFGAGLQEKLINWKRASHHYVLLDYHIDHSDRKKVRLQMNYAVPDVYGMLAISYEMNSTGAVKVTETFHADSSKQEPMMFKFGMQMMLPREYDQMKWFGRGPSENYWDRKDAAFVGLYDMSVSDQFHPYLRPQETANKTDVRWVTLTDGKGKGIVVTGDTVLNISARHFLDEDLDEGIKKHNRHAGQLKPRDLTTLSIDLQQTGVGGINSWGTWPLKQYRMEYKDYTYSFTIKPVK